MTRRMPPCARLYPMVNQSRSGKSRLDSHSGSATNSPTASTMPSTVANTEMTDIRLTCSFFSHHFSKREGSPSSPYTSALRMRILDPPTSDATKLTTPRTMGILEQMRMPLEGCSLRLSTWMLPSGSRTAVAYAVLPRIMTPSRTACPPMYVRLFFLFFCFIFCFSPMNTTVSPQKAEQNMIEVPPKKKISPKQKLRADTH